MWYAGVKMSIGRLRRHSKLWLIVLRVWKMVARTYINLTVPTVERTVRFYRITAGLNADGSPRNYDVSDALKRIERLPFNATPQYHIRYMANGGKLWFTTLHPSATGDEFAFWQSTRDDLPLEENDGHIRELTIDANAGLADAMHIVFFPPNILGIATNGGGSRITKLGDYLFQKTPELGKAEIQPLVHPDVRERLARIGEIKLLEFTIRPSYTDIVGSMDTNLGNAFRSIRSVWEEQERLELIIRPTKGTGTRAKAAIIPAIQQLISRADFRSNSTKCKVEGIPAGSMGQLTVDVLSDKLIVKKEITKAGNRSAALDEVAAYHAIREAYSDLARDIDQAAGVEVCAEYSNGGHGTSSVQKQLQLF